MSRPAALVAAALFVTAFAPAEDHPVRVELIVEHASVQPGGSTRIGVYFDLEPGWHIYAEDPGDAGLPTKVTWAPVPWVAFGPLHWPPPHEFTDPGDIHTRGYAGAVVLYSTLTLTPPHGAVYWNPGELPIRAHVEWLACKDICIPGSADLQLELPYSTEPPILSTHALFFDHAPEP